MDRRSTVRSAAQPQQQSRGREPKFVGTVGCSVPMLVVSIEKRIGTGTRKTKRPQLEGRSRRLVASQKPDAELDFSAKNRRTPVRRPACRKGQWKNWILRKSRRLVKRLTIFPRSPMIDNPLPVHAGWVGDGLLADIVVDDFGASVNPFVNF